MSDPDFKPPDTSRMLRMGIISGLFGLTVIVLVTVAVGRSAIDQAALAEIAGRANWMLMLLSMVVMSLAFVFLGHRWRVLFPGGQSPWIGLAAILCAGCSGTARSLALSESWAPFDSPNGTGWRSVYLWLPGWAPESSAWLPRAAAVCFVVARPPVPEEYRTAIDMTAALVALLAVGLTVVICRPEWMVGISRLSVARFRPLSSLHRTVEEATDGLLGLRAQGPAAYLKCILWSILAHGTVYLGIAIAAWALGSSPSMSGLLFTYATTTAAVIVMFALPGSQVGWDAIFLTLLTTTAGLALPDALAVAIVVRVQQLAIMCIGAAALTWLARTASSGEE